MSKIYKKAMDTLSVLHHEGVSKGDLMTIVLDYAKNHPTAFLKSSVSFQPVEKYNYRAECRDLVMCGRKIEAIQLWRTHTGQGLRESKDAVEALV